MAKRAKRDRPKRKTISNPIYGYEWKKARERFIVDKPYCSICGRIAEPPHVDHIIPHRNCEIRMWDESNWRVLCPVCHGRKSAGE